MASRVGVTSRKTQYDVSLLVMLCLSSPASGAIACESLEEFHLLLGQWESSEGARITTEIWTKLSATEWNGVGAVFDSQNQENVFTKSIALTQSTNGIVYSALPQQNTNATNFLLTGCKDGDLIFTNPTNDFPKSIRYQQQSQRKMLVTVSGSITPIETDSSQPILLEEKENSFVISFSKRIEE